MASSPISRADIKHLNKPELDHEIKIRGQEPLGKNCNKRKQLLILLQREQRGSITQAMDAIVVTPIEAREVAELVTITVQKLKSENERDLCRRHSRYSARLNHYAHRVTRWTETDPEVKVYKDQILEEIQGAFTIVDQHLDKLSARISLIPVDDVTTNLAIWRNQG
uniref:Uncharacterized protein n=1 Tax=Cacopsylla melanoneura TaxID=428564 RepID=A0A8D8TB22_9HEMI